MPRWVGRWEGGRVRESRTGRVWVIERQVGGARRTIPLAAKTERDALAELALFLRDPDAYGRRAAPKKPPPRAPVIDEAFVGRYLKAGVGKGLTHRYLVNVRSSLAWWADVLDGRPIAAATTAELLGALEGGPGAKGKLISLKAWTAWLRSTGQLASRDDPTLDMRVPAAVAARSRAPKWSRIEDVVALYRAIDDQRVRDVLRIRATTGMHHTELARIAAGKGRIREVWDGPIAAAIDFPHKSGKVHRLAISPATLGALRRYIDRQGPVRRTGWVSESHFCREVARVAEAHGLAPCPPGQLRHSYATWARMAGELVQPSTSGLPIEAVAAALGHASPETTRRYYDQSDRPAMVVIRGLDLEHPGDPPPPHPPLP